jgi:hypothetical protein
MRSGDEHIPAIKFKERVQRLVKWASTDGLTL